MRVVFSICCIVVVVLFIPSRCQPVENAGVHVTLYPPMNVSVGYISDKTAYVFWYSPPVYIHLNYSHKLADPKEPAPGKTGEKVTTVTETLDGQKQVPYKYGESPTNKTDNTHSVNVDSNSTQALVGDNSTEPTGNSSDISASSVTPAPAQTLNISKDLTPVHPDHSNSTVWTTWTPDHTYNETKQPMQHSDVVEFHHGHLTGYVVAWHAHNSEKISVQHVNRSTTELFMQGLTASTTYLINVSAVYMDKKIVVSNTVHFMTTDDKHAVCQCDAYGTFGGNILCKLTSHSICPCRRGYGGLFCERCGVGYYRSAVGLPCWACPCDKKSSTGSCHFEEQYLYCDTCKEGYAGNLCHQCSRGFYRYSAADQCVPCACHGHSDTCNKQSGWCLNCKHNTTGFSCDNCKDGYVHGGEPLGNCTHKDDLAKTKGRMNTAVIALVCVSVILLLSGVVGILVYRKWKQHPAAKPFWTVELQNDHEGVNFSSVPEDELHTHVEDMNFYERHDKSKSKSKRGTNKYSPLREDL